MYQVTSQTTSVTFQVNNAKLYILVVILSIDNDNKFLENIKQGLKIATSWNKHRSEITAEPKQQ